MKLIFKLFLVVTVSLLWMSGSFAQGGDFDDIFKKPDGIQSHVNLSKLIKQNKAIVIAGGRYNTKRLIWGRVTGSLTGYFFKHPNKPRKTFYGGADSLLVKSGYDRNGHRVSVVDAGSWVMYSWLAQVPNVTISPKDSFDKPLAKFKIKPGEVVYLGRLVVNHYVDEDRDGKLIVPKPIEVINDTTAAKQALKREYPRLVKHMTYRPLELVKKK